MSAKLVSAFEDRRCHVVSATDPVRPYSRFSRQEQLHFLPNSSSTVLTMLSGLRSRPITSENLVAAAGTERIYIYIYI
jgi:hypothetical protein